MSSKKKVGRPSAYKRLIEPNLEKIRELLEKGKSDREIALNLGIGYSTWNKYKAEFIEFKEFIETNRSRPIIELENSMYQTAIGFSKVVKKAMKVKDVSYEDGRKVAETERVEYYEEEVYFPPNPTSAMFLLKNWDRSNYSTNPAELDVKKKELELKEKALEDTW